MPLVSHMVKTASIVCFCIFWWLLGSFTVGTLTHLKTTWPCSFMVNNKTLQVECSKVGSHGRCMTKLLDGMTKLEQFQIRGFIRKMKVKKLELGG